MTHHSRQYNRKSIRLKQYNYAQKGAYFITICSQDRVSLFGQVEEGKLQMNEAGKMVERWYQCLGTKFSDIICGPYVVMPNHFHAIIINNGMVTQGGSVGVNQSVYPTPSPHIFPNNKKRVPTNKQHKNKARKRKYKKPPSIAIKIDYRTKNRQCGKNSESRKVATKLSTVVQWFKTMTTNEYIRGVKKLKWQPFRKRVWQRNYWEHIIRSDQAYEKITKYIYDNPKNWQTDRLK